MSFHYKDRHFTAKSILIDFAFIWKVLLSDRKFASLLDQHLEGKTSFSECIYGICFIF